jgi:hypothetical protein
VDGCGATSPHDLCDIDTGHRVGPTSIYREWADEWVGVKEFSRVLTGKDYASGYEEFHSRMRRSMGYDQGMGLRERRTIDHRSRRRSFQR